MATEVSRSETVKTIIEYMVQEDSVNKANPNDILNIINQYDTSKPMKQIFKFIKSKLVPKEFQNIKEAIDITTRKFLQNLVEFMEKNKADIDYLREHSYYDRDVTNYESIEYEMYNRTEILIFESTVMSNYLSNIIEDITVDASLSDTTEFIVNIITLLNVDEVKSYI